MGESLFAPELLEMLWMLPSYYLSYHYYTDRVAAEIRAAGKTRGEIVLEVEGDLLEMYKDPALVAKPKLLEQRRGSRGHGLDHAFRAAVGRRWRL